MATPKPAPIKPTPKPKPKARKPKPKATSASVGMFAPHPDPSMNPVGAAGAGYHLSDPALTAPQAQAGLTAPQGATSVPGQAAPPPPHPDAALLDIIHAAIASHRAAVK